MEPHEEVKINDFNAHYEVIRRNIQEANADLSGIFAKQKIAEHDLSTLKSQVSEESKKLDALLVRADSINHDLTKSHENLANAKDSHEADKVAHAAKVEKDHAALGARIHTTNEELSATRTKLSSLLLEESAAQTRVTTLHDEEATLRSSVENLSQTKRTLEEEIADVIHTMILSHEQHNKHVEERKNKIAHMDAQVAASIAAVTRPHEILDEREKMMDQREKDFSIRKLRFSQQFQELYPDQTPQF